ncbi:NUDIX hydrolase [Longispora urticae]
MNPLYDDAVRVFRDVPRTADLLVAGPVALTRAHLPGHVTASTLVLSHDHAEVLLTLHPKFSRWVQLGGHLEPGDASLADAALREAVEESGIADLVLHPEPIHFDVHPVACGGGSAHHDVRYVAVAPEGAVFTVSEESDELGWFPVDALPSPLADATECLIAPALAAVRRA